MRRRVVWPVLAILVWCATGVVAVSAGAQESPAKQEPARSSRAGAETGPSEDAVWAFPASALLDDLPRLTGRKLHRVSSADPKGANEDFIGVLPGERRVLFDQRGPACIRHIWMTLKDREPDYLRKIVLRMYWDGEQTPSVEVPLGDFFGVGHARMVHYVSLPMTMTLERGFNCFLPMPFDRRGVITIENQGSEPIQKFWFQMEYESYSSPLTPDVGRFHACWRRENPTQAERPPTNKGAKQPALSPVEGNYVILHAQGRGKYVGCNLSVHALEADWWGEGDDMIVIDGQRTLLGTGAEDYFCSSFGFEKPFYGPLFGAPYIDSVKDPEQFSAYRWHLEAPIEFEREIRVTIEHGSQNTREDDYSSTAYWYQIEPHAPFEPLAPAEKRLPRQRKRPMPPSEGEARPRPMVAPVPSPEPEEVLPGAVDLAVLKAVGLTVWLPLLLIGGGYWFTWRRRKKHPGQPQK